MPDSTFFVLIVLVGIAVAAFAVYSGVAGRTRLAKMEEEYRRICAEHGFEPTDQPLGLSDSQLVTLGLLPRGDRAFSAVWGVQAPATLELAGSSVPVESSAFEWWWEERQTHTDANGNTQTTWHRRSSMVTLVRFRGWNLTRISCEPAGWFNRMGITGRRDFKTESAEFNRRYDIKVSDPQLAIRLFEPEMQLALLEGFAGSSFELDGELAAVRFTTPGSKWSGSTESTRRGAESLLGIFQTGGDRIRTNPAIVAALPVVHRQGLELLTSMPASWWRALQGGSG